MRSTQIERLDGKPSTTFYSFKVANDLLSGLMLVASVDDEQVRGEISSPSLGKKELGSSDGKALMEISQKRSYQKLRRTSKCCFDD